MSSDSKVATAVIGRWKVMTTSLQPQLEKLPQLTGQYTELVKATSDAEALETRQALLKADLQELNQQRRTLLKSGETLRNRIGAALKGEHGFTSERLLEFGLQPRRPRGRGKNKKTKPTDQPTTPSSTAK
jgi:hypothetical protein